MNGSFTASEIREESAKVFCDHSISDLECRARRRAMLRAFADRLESDEKVQPTGFVSAGSLLSLQSCRNDEYNGTVALWMRPNEAAKANVPIYPHRAPADAERLAETLPSDDWFANEICEARNHWHEHHEANWLETDDNHPDDFMGKWLRSKLLAAHDTHPQPAQDAKDAKDAARYRWLREHHDSARPDWHIRTPTNDAPAIGALDAAIDAAMAKESGR